MALTSLDQAYSQLDNNILYEGDLSKSQLFLEAIRYLLIHDYNTMSNNGRSFSRESLKDMENTCRSYLKTINTSKKCGQHWAKPID